MSISAGNCCYTLSSSNSLVIARGLSWTPEELNDALANEIADIIFDKCGTADCMALLESLPDTGFDRGNIQRIFSTSGALEDWRVGEALAESYLINHRQCIFPWPDSRDERISGASLPGADLVGFYRDNGGVCFVFGEVKTSSDSNCPPGVIYGRSGLQKQLENLRDRNDIRDGLVKYLCHRALNASWQDLFKEAAERYLRNNTDVRLFGVLVRDVQPDQNDLRSRVNNLGQGCPGSMRIELIAIYLPAESIKALSKLVTPTRRGSDA